MKNKILFALLVLVVAFSLVGCGPSESQFYGVWKADSSITQTYELKKDGNWSYEWNNLNLLIIREYGTWVWNGDNTASLTDEDGNEFTATYNTYSEEVIDEETGEEVTRYKFYLLINDVKYWEVKEEYNSEE